MRLGLGFKGRDSAEVKLQGKEAESLGAASQGSGAKSKGTGGKGTKV